MKNLALFSAIILSVIAPLRAEPFPAPLQSALDKYLQIQTALAADSVKGVATSATELAAVAKASSGVVPEAVGVHAEALAKTTDIKTAREAFKPLSATLVATLTAQKTKSGQYYEAFCPMAKASWIQSGQKISNPYFGPAMLSCGEIREAL